MRRAAVSKPALSSPVTSKMLKTELTGHMTAQHLNQVVAEPTAKFDSVSVGNKAALILLIGRNVPVETRKTLIQMGLNQSHASRTEFQEDTC